jgi:uncharacterized damage-inducible protein DinB
MTYEELQSAIVEIERNAEAVAASLAGLPDTTLRYKTDPRKWCILEILGHLADVELVYGHRLRQAIAEQDPTFAVMEQDDWARNLGYLDSAAEDLLEVYGVNRAATLRLLRRVHPEDLAKGGFHPELGRKLTVAELVERIRKHDPNHLGQIERLKQAAPAAATT